MLDVAIIGSGPAALTAAMYVARAGLTVEIIEKNRMGGSLPDISHLSNFPGFDGEGGELAERMLMQVKNLGAYYDYGVCKSIKPFMIDGEEKFVRAIIVAPGTEPIHIDLPTAKPIFYSVPSEKDQFISKKVLIVGGSNSAVSEAIYLAKNVVKSLAIISDEKLKAERMLVNELRSLKNVVIYEEMEPTIEFLDSFDGIFVIVGKKPATDFLPREMLDDEGFILTDNTHMTKIPGVFAAGDACAGTLKQPIAAAADGAMAAIGAIDFLNLGKRFQ